MSEISKARDRMLRHIHQDDDQAELQSQSRQPRKFTVSSLTHHFQRSQPKEPESPSGMSYHGYNYGNSRQGNNYNYDTEQNYNNFGATAITPQRLSFDKKSVGAHRSHTPDQRASTPLLKTIHLKINQIHELSAGRDSFSNTQKSRMSVQSHKQRIFQGFPYQTNTPQNHNQNQNRNQNARTYREQEQDQYEHTSRVIEDSARNPRDIQQSRYNQSPPKPTRLHTSVPQLLILPQPQRRHHSPFKPRQTLKQYAESLVQQHRGKLFTDEFFPPAHSIVFNRRILYQEQGLKFQRLGQIYNGSSVLPCLSYACEPTLLTLGKYTNPYLYSALSILAQTPGKILTLFGSTESTSTSSNFQSGLYHLNLCKDGVWRYIVVDDHMPVKSIAGRKTRLFLHSKEDGGRVELWPAVVEKAVAKVYGTYLDLAMVREEGMGELFRLLTGAPMVAYQLTKDFRSFLILIDSALKRNHIVTLESLRQGHTQHAGQAYNLHPHQAYRIISIKKSGIKLRNYADIPSLTTKLSFSECSQLFQRLAIYRVEDNYRYVTHKLRHRKGCYSMVKITVGSVTRGYVDVWQNNPAYYKKHLGSNIGYAPSRVRVCLVPLSTEESNDEGNLNVNGSRNGSGNGDANEGEWLEPGKEVVLEQGEYLLKVHLCQEKQYDFTVSYYGERDVGMERVRVAVGEKWIEPCLCVGGSGNGNGGNSNGGGSGNSHGNSNRGGRSGRRR